MDVYSILMLHYLKQNRNDDDIQALQRVAEEKKLWNYHDTSSYDPEATALAKKARIEQENAEAALHPIENENLK
jgi:hypothetical protein